MAVHHEVDAGNRIVWTMFSGLVGHRDPDEHSLRLRNDLAFDASFSELVEFAEGSDVQLSYLDFQSQLRLDPFSKSSRRAFVVGSRSAVYGTVRMYQIMRNDATCVKIFATTSEAVLWLTAPAHLEG
jgi:hypothetical protein